MKRRYAVIRRSKYIVFLLGIIVLLFIFFWYIIHNFFREDLSSCLEKDELLIDYTIDDSLVYALVNKQGLSDYGDFFVIFENKSDGWIRIYENDFKNLMPWKIEIADIDGDNIKDILIAVKKATYFDNELKNRMFIFNFTEGILVRKWTGSQIAGIWREFYVGDILSIPGNELIFIEYINDMEKVSIYSWFDFGFIKIAESETYPRIEDLTIVDYNRLEITTEEDGQKINHILTAVDGKLMILTEEKN